MKDPRKETREKKFEILYLAYNSDNKTLFCDGYIYGESFELAICQEDKDFERFFPKTVAEFKMKDDTNNVVCRLDGHLNMHSLIELFDFGHVIQGYVSLKPILEELAEEYLRNH